MATTYSVHIEFERRDLPPAEAERILTQLEDWHAAVGHSPRGYVDVQITLPAEDLARAASTALAIAAPVVNAQPIRVEAMTEAEFDARLGEVPMPELVGVTDAAEMLGVSRQRVLQMVDEGKLAGTRIGKSIALARDEVLARSAADAS
jgi:excisionase family DNA binding protein